MENPWNKLYPIQAVEEKKSVPNVQLVADSTTRVPPDDRTKGRLVFEMRWEYLSKVSPPASWDLFWMSGSSEGREKIQGYELRSAQRNQVVYSEKIGVVSKKW